ncbi:hypothetical protein HDV06_002723 [Boothiomyces sp. JEL0866]|nr:hypothetical protein HDV06_002723 [Boothiomyces sp. JEL0866]
MEIISLVIIIQGILATFLLAYGTYSVISPTVQFSCIFKITYILMLMQSFIEVVCVLVYRFFYQHYYLTRVAGTIVYFLVLTNNYLNIQVLQVFAVLIPRVTPTFIFKCKVFLFVWFIVTNFHNIIGLLYGPVLPEWIIIYNPFGTILFAISSILYDNGQAIALTMLVFNTKKIKSRGNLSQDTLNSLKKMVIASMSILVFDWSSFVLFAGVMGSDVQTSSNPGNPVYSITELSTCLHGCCAVFIIQMLKNLTFSDLKKKQTK